jgi:hypothetical protein
MCVACRRRAAQPELIRLSRGPAGRLQVEAWPRAGRGAYVCPCWQCLKRAIGKRTIRHALRIPGSATLPSAEQVLAEARQLLDDRYEVLQRRGGHEDQRSRDRRLLAALTEQGPGAEGSAEKRRTVDGARRFGKVAQRALRPGRKGGPANAHG